MCAPGYKCLVKTLREVRINKMDDSEMNFGSYSELNVYILQRPQVEEPALTVAMTEVRLVKK